MRARELQQRDSEIAAATAAAERSGVGRVAIDLCFVIDATSSMQPYIDEAKRSLQGIVREFQRRYGDRAMLRLAVVAYRDLEDVEPRQVLDFTSDAVVCLQFIKGLRAETALRPTPEGCSTRWREDWPEDLTGALHDTAFGLSWRQACRAAIIITDAPCHGRDFYDLGTWGYAGPGDATVDGVAAAATVTGVGTVKPEEVDNHPDGDPRGRDPRDLVRTLRRKGVDLHFFGVECRRTATMVAQLARAYDSCPGRTVAPQGAFKLHEHDMHADPTAFVVLVLGSINRSLSQSSSRSLGGSSFASSVARAVGTKAKFRPAILGTLDEAADPPPPPPWGPTERVEVYSTFGGGRSVGADTVRVQHRPFGRGAMRAAFWALPGGQGPLGGARPLVVKEGLQRGAAHNSKEALLRDLDSQATAGRLAEAWNRAHGATAGSGEVRFLPGFALCFPDRPSGQSRWLAAEAALPGTGPAAAGEEAASPFRKYNNNGGFVDVADDAELANAFSHWTWVASAGELMVLDVQGAPDGKGGIVCTDAQVQHRDPGRYGHGNRGERGMGDFFAAHRCGGLCARLGLRRPGDIAALPVAHVVGVVGAEGGLDLAAEIPAEAAVVPEEAARPRTGAGEVWQPATEAISRPPWVPDGDVFRCPVRAAPKCQARGGQEFWLFDRRHHCRSCGNVTCGKCSRSRVSLPFEAPGSLHRVCDACMRRFTGGGC